MPEFSLADILGAQAGAPGPVYEGGPTGNVRAGDLLTALGLGGPSWLDRAQKQTAADVGAYQQGGVPALMADRGETADLAGGFAGTTTPKGIRAYHGSPYDFDKFDLAHIGTGEGAQVKGHGFYFAENPLVAEEYKRNLALRRAPSSLTTAMDDVHIGGQPIKQRFDIDTMPEFSQFAASGDTGSARTFANDRLMRWQQLAEDKNYPFQDYARDKIAAYEGLEKAFASGEVLHSPRPPQGRMYEVNINAKPEHLLDYDAPFAAQSPQVQQGLVNTLSERAGKPITPEWMDTFSRSGEGLQSLVAAWNKHDPMRTSAALNEAGIPGIRYLDQGSRGANQGFYVQSPASRGDYFNVVGPGNISHGQFPSRAAASEFANARNAEGQTSNYVVFNPDIVDIRKKWALLLAAMGGAGAPTMGSVLQSQSQSPQ